MASRDELRQEREAAIDAAEVDVLKYLLEAFAQWLKDVAERVLSAFRNFGLKPDPTAVWAEAPKWIDKVDLLLAGPLEKAVRRGWHLASGRTYVSGNSFVQAQLAMTRNFLVRVPDEVYNLIFAEISDGVNAGQSNREIAERVDTILSDTKTARWRNRAQLIAQTETMRAFNAGAFGSAIQAQQIEQEPLVKEWLTMHDNRVRLSHREADEQQQPVMQPFIVGGYPLMFPGDPMGPPDEVIGCRCTVLVKERE